MKARCDRCGKLRVLSEYTPNQMATLRLCAACIRADREARSEAARGVAGPKPKAPSQLEDQKWNLFLTAADSRAFETLLAAEGYHGSRGKMLKQWVLDAISRWRRK